MTARETGFIAGPRDNTFLIHSRSKPFGAVRTVPCGPNPSRLTVLLTRDLNGIIYRYLFPHLCIVFAILILFAKPLDFALRPLGYDNGFVSYFPFVRYLHSHLISFNENAHPDIAYFHVLDLTVWMSVAVWGSRLVAGVVFLKRYDALYLMVSRRLSKMPLGLRCAFYAGVAWGVLVTFAITYVPVQPKMLRDPEVNFVISYLPGAFIFLFATAYYVLGFLLTELALFLLWKLVRQRRVLEASNRLCAHRSR